MHRRYVNGVPALALAFLPALTALSCRVGDQVTDQMPGGAPAGGGADAAGGGGGALEPPLGAAGTGAGGAALAPPGGQGGATGGGGGATTEGTAGTGGSPESPSQYPAVEKPNVLMIIADDLGKKTGTFGYPGAITPNLDRLAQAGVRFNHAFSQAPHCSPSRTSFLHGRHPGRGKGPALPELFQQNGYVTARVGKVFHQGVPNEIGTNGSDDNASWDEFSNPAGVDVQEAKNAQAGGAGLSYLASDSPDDQHTDGKVAAEAMRLIDKHGDKPFFIAAGFYRPHEPFIAPRKYFEMHPLLKVQLAAVADDDLADVPGAAWANSMAKLPTDQQRRLRQAYNASTSFVDAQIGKVLQHLERKGLRKNTVVVLFGDHGYSLGEHFLWKKKNLFENGNGTPLLMAGPGIKAGATSDAMVGLIDLYPTLAALAGFAPPPDVEGGSLLPLLRGELMRPFRKGVLSICEPGICKIGGKSVRTPRYRYNEWQDGQGGAELYDLMQDPDERRNLANMAEHKVVRDQLRAWLAGDPRALLE